SVTFAADDQERAQIIAGWSIRMKVALVVAPADVHAGGHRTCEPNSERVRALDVHAREIKALEPKGLMCRHHHMIGAQRAAVGLDHARISVADIRGGRAF